MQQFSHNIRHKPCNLNCWQIQHKLTKQCGWFCLQPLTIIKLPSPIHPHRPFRQGSMCKHITVAILALFITANTDRICIHHRPIIFIQAYIPTNANKSLQGRFFCVQSLSVRGHLPTGSTLDIKIPRLYNGLARAVYFPYTSLTSDTPQPQKSSVPPASNNI